MDSLRFADLLVVLLCKGRIIFSKSLSTTTGSAACKYYFFYYLNFFYYLASLSSASADRTHRHLIDAIRQRDTEALIDAIENRSVFF